MAITVTVKSTINLGNKWEITGTIAMDTSYATGGYPITARQVALAYIDDLILDDGYGGYLYAWDGPNSKIKVFYPQGGSSAGTNDGSGTVKTGASTASAVNATTPDVNSAKAIEVQNTANLSAVTALNFRAIGV